MTLITFKLLKTVGYGQMIFDMHVQSQRRGGVTNG